MHSLGDLHAAYQGDYFDNVLRIHPGNMSPVAQPRDLLGDTVNVLAPPAEQLPKCNPFRLHISGMVLFILLVKGNHEGIHIPTYRQKTRKRNVKELAERSQRIFAFLDPLPKLKAQASGQTSSLNQRGDGGV